MQQLPLGMRLADRAVFASFLPARNGEALEHVRNAALARGSGASWLCGPAGAGKTHLLQAACALAAQSMRAGYFPLGALGALGVGVLEGLAELQCVCLDDLEVAIGHPQWERALFGVLREVEENGGALLMAARSPPALLTWTLPDLGSRCAAASIFQLRVLDEAEQSQALQLRARLRGLELPEETSRWLQRRFPRDMRQLYELLDTLDDAALAAQRRLTVPFIREVLAGR